MFRILLEDAKNVGTKNEFNPGCDVNSRRGKSKIIGEDVRSPY